MEERKQKIFCRYNKAIYICTMIFSYKKYNSLYFVGAQLWVAVALWACSTLVQGKKDNPDLDYKI